MEVTQERLDKFNEALKVLLDEHSFGLSSEAFIVEGKIATKVVVVDVPAPKKDEKDKK